MTPTVFLLAAGRSQRFNYRPKQLLRFRGETILQRTIRLIREINPDIPIYLVTVGYRPAGLLGKFRDRGMFPCDARECGNEP